MVNDNDFVDAEATTHRLIIVNDKFKNPNNENNAKVRKSRFITAHEYGHFILHKQPEEALYAHRDSDKRENDLELEADYFARAILMPAETFLVFVDLLDEIVKKQRKKREISFQMRTYLN